MSDEGTTLSSDNFKLYMRYQEVITPLVTELTAVLDWDAFHAELAMDAGHASDSLEYRLFAGVADRTHELGEFIAGIVKEYHETRGTDE